ncbi:unnamed protein product [Soboliphyme baturini]|uniref:MFS domain-containing protein n=1 Tax=Soboliphyme baturini TaxID=241478 RepID=A0A183J2B3_9BILA|nr:unnamed protein product [Soboliphyme baturini]
MRLITGISFTEQTRTCRGGYGWIVVMATFVTYFIADGISFSFGVLLPVIEDQFHCSKSESPIVGSIYWGATQLARPLASSLIESHDSRIVAVISATVSFIAIFISNFSPYLWLTTVTFELIGGTGVSICYTTGMVAVAQYFCRKRGIATGMTLAGSGFGTVALPPLVGYLLNTYRWNGAVLLLSGIALDMVLSASLLRDLRHSPGMLLVLGQVVITNCLRSWFCIGKRQKTPPLTTKSATSTSVLAKMLLSPLPISFVSAPSSLAAVPVLAKKSQSDLRIVRFWIQIPSNSQSYSVQP